MQEYCMLQNARVEECPNYLRKLWVIHSFRFVDLVVPFPLWTVVCRSRYEFLINIARNRNGSSLHLAYIICVLITMLLIVLLLGIIKGIMGGGFLQ
jgi:hypothetical protein